MGQGNKKILSCVFLLDVLCSYQRSEKPVILERCWDCPHYRRFLMEAEEEEEQFWDEVERFGSLVIRGGLMFPKEGS